MTEWDRDTPWRQGFLLPHEMVAALNLFDQNHPHDTIVIVATHDCDLAQSPENEPIVEVVVGHGIDAMDGNYTHAKTPRTLHIQFEGEDAQFAEFSVTEKCSIDKVHLNSFQPLEGKHLSPPGKTTFQRWLSARYRRSAFPDEFESRLRKTKLAKKIANAVKPHGELIVSVLFDVDEGFESVRTEPDDLYVLDITLLYSADSDPLEAEKAAQEAMDEIQSAFERKLINKDSDEWEQIELRYCEVISEDVLTYRQFSLMKPWRLEYISLGAEPQQEIPSE